MTDGIERRRVYSVQLFSHPVTCSIQAEQSSDSRMTLKNSCFCNMSQPLLSPVKTHHHEPDHLSGLSSSTTHGTSQQCLIATSSTCVCSHTLLPSRLADNGFPLLHLCWLSASLFLSSLGDEHSLNESDGDYRKADYGVWLRPVIKNSNYEKNPVYKNRALTCES